MWKDSLVELRGIVEPGGKRAKRAAEIVQQVRSLPDILVELKNIVQASGKEAHRVASLVEALLELPEWIDGEHAGLRDAAEQELDRLCRMIALTVDELLAMISFFPQPEKWDKADLVALRDEAVKLQREKDESRRAKERAKQQWAGPVGNGMASNGRHPEPHENGKPPDERKVATELAREFDHKLKEKTAVIVELTTKLSKQESEAGSLHATVAKLQVGKKSDADTIRELREQLAAAKAEIRTLKAKVAKLEKRGTVRAGR